MSFEKIAMRGRKKYREGEGVSTLGVATCESQAVQHLARAALRNASMTTPEMPRRIRCGSLAEIPRPCIEIRWSAISSSICTITVW